MNDKIHTFLIRTIRPDFIVIVIVVMIMASAFWGAHQDGIM